MNDKRRQNSDERSYYNAGPLIRQLAKTGMTPRQVSIKAGVSTHAVADALSAECKKFETLWLIANAAGVKWETLFKDI